MKSTRKIQPAQSRQACQMLKRRGIPIESQMFDTAATAHCSKALIRIAGFGTKQAQNADIFERGDVIQDWLRKGKVLPAVPRDQKYFELGHIAQVGQALITDQTGFDFQGAKFAKMRKAMEMALGLVGESQFQSMKMPQAWKDRPQAFIIAKTRQLQLFEVRQVPEP
jgi:hypothetical protein